MWGTMGPDGALRGNEVGRCGTLWSIVGRYAGRYGALCVDVGCWKWMCGAL